MKPEQQAALRALQKGETINPQDVVNAARSPEHPLHERFPWDDKEAANQWRLDIAAKLITEYLLIVKVDSVVVPLRFYRQNPIRVKGKRSYRTLKSMREQEELARANLATRVKPIVGTVRNLANEAGYMGFEQVKILAEEAIAPLEQAQQVLEMEPVKASRSRRREPRARASARAGARA